MKVLKFGGTSVGDPDNIRRVVDVVKSRSALSPLLVFSAMGDTTDRLLEIGARSVEGRLQEALGKIAALEAFHSEIARAVLPEKATEALEACAPLFEDLAAVARSLSVLGDLSPTVQDRLLGTGELLSTRIMTAALQDAGLPAVWADSREVVVTDGRHTQAEPLFEATSARAEAVLRPLVEEGKIPVLQGFIARSEAGVPTTLGRGGSDYTASLLGAVLGAEEIEIWTDVDGIMTADPSLVPEARNIPLMSFREAAELAFFGARVLHPKTLAPAVERGIPVRVLNTAHPEGAGTVVLASAPGNGHAVKSIAYKEGMTVLNLVSARMFKAHGFLRRVFEVLEKHRIAPDLVSTSEVSVALAAAPSNELQSAASELRDLGEVTLRVGQAVVAVVGENLKQTPGIVGRVFEDLHDVRIAMVSQGGSEIALSFAVGEGDLPLVISRLHRRFFG
jgi:aspartate kinase